MRGGAQACLLACDDGRWYVTKFRQNPQHRRVLVNEWIAARLTAHLSLAAPEARVVELSAAFLAANPDANPQLASRRLPVSPGWHYGSQFPGNPHSEAVYDYLPDQLLASVVNVRDFLGALVLDRWCANSDARQAVFFRRRVREWLPGADVPAQQKGFVAWMVDNGYLFDGPHWTFADSPLQGLYMRPLVYAGIRNLDDFQPWLDLAAECPTGVLDEALRSLPREWLEEDDERRLEDLLEQLVRRRRRIADLLLATVRARPAAFPSWSAGAPARAGA